MSSKRAKQPPKFCPHHPTRLVHAKGLCNSCYAGTYRRPHLVAYQRAYLTRLREAVFAKLGNLCARCGFADPRALQIDHVFGQGTAERIGRKRGGKDVGHYLEILADTTGRYQVLCANCNMIKAREDGSFTLRLGKPGPWQRSRDDAPRGAPPTKEIT